MNDYITYLALFGAFVSWSGVVALTFFESGYQRGRRAEAAEQSVEEMLRDSNSRGKIGGRGQ